MKKMSKVFNSRSTACLVQIWLQHRPQRACVRQEATLEANCGRMGKLSSLYQLSCFFFFPFSPHVYLFLFLSLSHSLFFFSTCFSKIVLCVLSRRSNSCTSPFLSICNMDNCWSVGAEQLKFLRQDNNRKGLKL